MRICKAQTTFGIQHMLTRFWFLKGLGLNAMRVDVRRHVEDGLEVGDHV